MIIGLCCLLFIWGCEECTRRVFGGFAGSYPYAESWTINASEQETLEAIKNIKQESPLLQPPDQRALVPVRDSATGYWAYVDFYYADTKEVVHAWTREGSEPNTTTFAFVSISRLNDPTDSRLINKDFWYVANRRQINRFKSRIVDRINAELTQ